MKISVSEIHNKLSQWLDEVEGEPITITRWGKPVGVIIPPAEYERLRRVQAYLQMLRLSRTLANSGVTANELFESSRTELEERP